MSRRTFRLAAILRLRQSQEKQAAGQLARANDLLSSAEANVVSSSHRHAAHALQSGSGIAFLASVAARAALNATAQDALVERQLAATDVENATSGWRDARRSTKSLEHLQERHDRVEREAEAAHEQKALDGLAGRSSANGLPLTAPRSTPDAQDRDNE